MKAALITGASGGIGEAFARRLASEGHDLMLVARSEQKLRSLCDELRSGHNITAHYIAVDLLEPGSDEILISECTRRGVEIETLINNAGIGSQGDFATLELERELEIIDLNISVLVALTHRILPGMRQRKRGTIINVSSAAGFQPLPFMATYAASKAFVTSFSEALAEENRPFGIQVLALCPGSTKTNFFEAANIERPLNVKGQETPEQVVDTAMNALDGRRTRVVSGWMNWVAASSSSIVPNALITRVVGRALRPRYQKELTPRPSGK